MGDVINLRRRIYRRGRENGKIREVPCRAEQFEGADVVFGREVDAAYFGEDDDDEDDDQSPEHASGNETNKSFLAILGQLNIACAEKLSANQGANPRGEKRHKADGNDSGDSRRKRTRY